MNSRPASAPPSCAKAYEPLLAEKHGDRDERVDGGHVTGLDADHKEEQELHIAVKHSQGDEHAEDAAHGAIERNLQQRGVHGVADDIDGCRGQRGSEHRRRVEAAQPVRAVQAFEDAAHQPEGKQLPEGSPKRLMNQAISDGLPQPAAEEGLREEDEMIEYPVVERPICQLREQQREEGEEVEEDQLAGGASEVGKGKRKCAAPGHGQPKVKLLGHRVSLRGAAASKEAAPWPVPSMPKAVRIGAVSCVMLHVWGIGSHEPPRPLDRGAFSR